MLKFRKRQVHAVLLAGATLMSLPVPAVLGQSSLELEEVIVTARKRAESLQEAPLAISALSGADLLDAGITNLADITEIVPNLQINRPSRDSTVYIRGVGPARGATNVTELSVGVYIDNVFLLKPYGQMMDLAEIESVQVLRGPQGTLFGKNTTGGALVVTTVKPGEELGGYAQVTVGNDNRLNVQASIDVPVTDSLLTKLTLTSVEVDGFFQDPVNGNELSNEDRKGGLLQVRWLASDALTADFSLFHNRIREEVLAMGDCVVTNPNSQIAANRLIAPESGFKFVSDFCEEVDTLYGGEAPYSDPPQYELDATQTALNLSWDINDNHTFRSISSWNQLDTPNIEYTNTYAGYPASNRALEDAEYTTLSQEFQLIGDFLDSRLRYTLGLFYLKDDTDTGIRETFLGTQGIWGSIIESVPEGLVFGQANISQVGQQNDNSTYAAYTQLSWDVTDSLELTAGVRYGYEERSTETERRVAALTSEVYANVPGALIINDTTVLIPYDNFFNDTGAALPVALGETERLDADKSFDSVTPMFSAAYTFSEDMLGDSIDGLMLYASYTFGYKAGGFSDFGTGELLPFEEETIDSIEIGAKLDAWDNRLRVNAAVFTMEYDDMQLFVARPDPDPDVVGSFNGVTNAGASSIDGVELEVTVLPAEGWTINFSASLADGKFDEFEDFIVVQNDAGVQEVVPVDRSAEDLPSLPESTYSLGIQYDFATSIGSWTVRADAYYRDELYWGFDGLTWEVPLAREEATTDAFTIYNARLNWQINDNLSVAAWGKNLADKTYYDGGVAETRNVGHVIKAFAPPRRYGIDLRYQF